MRIRAADVTAAAVCGLTTGFNTWHQLLTAPAGALRGRLLLSALGTTNSCAQAAGLGLEPLDFRPHIGLRERLSLAISGLMSLSLLVMGLNLVFGPRAEKQRRYEEWQEQRRRYALLARAWKGRDWRGVVAVWREVVRVQKAQIQTSQLRWILISAAVHGIAAGLSNLRRLSVADGRHRRFVYTSAIIAIPNTFVSLTGMLPNRLWFPRWVRIGAAVYVIQCNSPLRQVGQHDEERVAQTAIHLGQLVGMTSGGGSGW